MRVAFCGNSPWSVPTLQALAASPHEPVLVLTRPPVPGRRGKPPEATTVALAARAAMLPVLEVATVRTGDGLAALRAAAPDALVVVAYGELLSADVLAVPAVAPVNLHFSLLPAYRGAAPVQRALFEGATSTGVSTMRMDEGLDTGDVYLQHASPIEADDDAGSLGERLAMMGADLVVATIDGLAEGSLVPVPQEDDKATYAPKIPSRQIDWSAACSQVRGLVRALGPTPGATTSALGDVLKVLRVAERADVAGPPGEVVAISDEGPVVACGHGGVVLALVAPAGRNRMSGADFARGRDLRPGAVLGLA